MNTNMTYTEQLLNELTSVTKKASDGVIKKISCEITIAYYKTLVPHKIIVEMIEKPFAMYNNNFGQYLLTAGKPIAVQVISKNLIEGNIIVLYKEQLITMERTIKKEGRSVEQVVREANFEGGLQAFTENINININLIRQFYHNENLKIEEFIIGKDNENKVSLLYNEQYVDRKVLSDVQNRLNSKDIPDCLSASNLEQFLLQGQWIFPRLLSSERPDRTIMAMNKGKVVLLLEGASQATIAPTTFHDFFSTVDDKYLRPMPAIFLIVLRYIALLFSLLSPSLYVAFISYNPEVLRVQLALSIASSRLNVPYGSFIEVIFMLVLMEFLIEAS